MEWQGRDTIRIRSLLARGQLIYFLPCLVELLPQVRLLAQQPIFEMGVIALWRVLFMRLLWFLALLLWRFWLLIYFCHGSPPFALWVRGLCVRSIYSRDSSAGLV